MPAILSLTCQTCGTLLDAERSDGVCAICLFGEALDLDVNETFGGHELCGEIARGGMGVVYRAMQREPRREVALKTLRGGELDSPEAQARFRDEARTMAELEHPGILPIHQFGQQDGVLFFTMKLASGGTLAERTANYAGQWKEIAALTANVADAVQFAHEHGVLHRDIKPGNILFDEEDHAFVSDFGLAKLAERAEGGLTVSAAMLGTPHYMAPEIAAHGLRGATIATDVWSLGVVLYELLAQKRPFKSESMPALLREIAEREPDAMAPSVPSDLRIIASKALAKDPARRYVSSRALADDLRCWLEGRPITARPTPGAERLWLWMRRNPALAAVSVLAGLGIAAAISSLAWGLDRAKQEAKNMAAARDQIASANKEGQEQLRDALVQRATSGRIAAMSGWRDSGLKALKQAAAIRGGVDVRSEAIAHLVGVDLSITGPLPVMKGWLDDIPAISASFDLFAYFSPNESEERFCDAQGKAVGVPVKITFPARRSSLRFMITSALDPTARRLVAERARGSGADHGDVVLIDVAGRRVLGQWKDATFGGFSADGELFALLFDGARVGVFQAADGREVGSIVSTLTGESRAGDQCAIYPSGDSSFVAYAQGSNVEIWNWRERSMKAQLQIGFAVRRMAWSGDALAIAEDTTFRGVLWGIRSQYTHAFSGEGSAVQALVAAPRAGLFSAAGSPAAGYSSLFDAITGQQMLRSTSTYPFWFSSEGRRFLALDGGRTMKLGELQTSEAIRTLDVSAFCTQGPFMDISPDGRWLVMAKQPDWNRRTGVTLLDLTTRQIVATHDFVTIGGIPFLADSQHLVGRLAKSPSETQYWLYRLEVEDGRVELKQQRALGEVEPKVDQILAISPNRRWVALRGPNQLVIIDPLAAGSPPQFQTSTVTERVRDFAGMSNEFFYGTGMRYGWNPPREDAVPTASASSRFSPDGRWACGTVSNQLRFYDGTTFQMSHAFPVENGTDADGFPVLTWRADSRYVAWVNRRTDVTILDTATWEIVAELKSPRHDAIRALQFTRDGRTLVILRDAGALEFWDLTKLSAELAALGISWDLPPPLPLPPPAISEPVKPLELPPPFSTSAATRK